MSEVDIIREFYHQHAVGYTESTRQNGLVCVIDWLSFTDVVNTDLQASLSEFGFSLEDFVDAERGASGYKRMLLHKGSTMRVLLDGNENMGIHYDFSGSSIKELFCHFSDDLIEDTIFGPNLDLDINILRELFTRIKMIGHVTRLDLAVDDKVCPYFNVLELYQITKVEKRFVSKFRSCDFRDSFKTSGEQVGLTLYFGNRVSNIMLRVYDKQLERIAKGIEGAEDVPWIRWEIELKDDYATAALNKLCNDVSIGSLLFGILSNYLRIIILDDSNKSRCSMDPKWKQFIGEVSSIKLFVMQPAPTLADKREWVLKQVAPTIAGLTLADSGDISWLTDNLGIHAERMNKHLKKLVARENPFWRELLGDLIV